jgi:hypothetical protein
MFGEGKFNGLLRLKFHVSGCFHFNLAADAQMMISICASAAFYDYLN